MKNFILLSLFLLSITTSASEIKTILSCREKFSELTITQNGNNFEINRSVLTNRVKGSLYVYGSVSTESSGIINAKSVSATSNKLIFTFDDGKTLNVSIIPGAKSEILYIKIDSNENRVVENLNAILNTSENELVFSSYDACSINL